MENTNVTASGPNLLKAGPNDFLQRSMNVSLVLIAAAKTFNAGSLGSLMKSTGHGMKKFDIIRITSGEHIFREFGVTGVDTNEFNVSHSFKDGDEPVNGVTFNHYRAITQVLDSGGNIQTVEGQTGVVDFYDLGSFAPTGGNLIPKSSSAPLKLVDSLAAAITRIQSISDVGVFCNLYSDSGGTVLIAHLVLTPDETVDVNLAIGTQIYIRAVADVDIDDASSTIAANLIGAV